MKSKMNRALSMLFALVMVVTVFPVMTSTAAETKAQNVDVLSYEDIYVKDGLVMWLDGFDASTFTLPAQANKDSTGAWTSKVGNVSATIYGGAYSESFTTGWKLGANGGISWTQDKAKTGTAWWQSFTNKIDLGIENLPVVEFTVETVLAADGVTLNGERYVSKQSESYYGFYPGEVFAFGLLRSMSYTTMHYTNDGTLTGDYVGNRWMISGALYSDYSSDFAGRKLDGLTLTTEHAFANYAVGQATVMSASLSRSESDKQTFLTAKIFYDGANVVNGYVVNDSYYRTTPELYQPFPAFNVGYRPNQIGTDENGKAIYGTPVEDSSRALFQVMNQMAGTVWGVRVYDRVLSDAEMAQNRFADLVAYYDMDLTAFSALTELQKGAVYFACKQVGFQLADTAAYSTAMAQIELAIAQASAKSGMTAYDELYIADGLVMLLSAYAGDTGSVDLLNGIWYNKASSEYAIIAGSLPASGQPYAWQFRVGGGIGYDLTTSELKSAKGGHLNLGEGIVSSLADFTVEYAGYLTGDGTTAWTYNTGRIQEMFGHWGGWRSSGDNGNANSDSYRALFGCLAQNANYGNNYQTYANYGYYQNSDVRSYSNVITYGVEKEGRTLLIDGVLKRADTTNFGSHAGSRTLTRMTTPNQVFFLMQNTTNSLYAVRVYDRALSAYEVNWNHFVDMAAYAQLNPALLENLSDGAKAELGSQFAGATVSGANSTVLASAVANAKANCPAATEYDELYVMDGLTALFTAYGNEANDANFNRGYWASKIGGAVISLYDNTDKAQWTHGSDLRGLQYSFANITDLVDNRTKIGMRLPTELLTNGNMAVEYVFAPNPVMDGDEQAKIGWNAETEQATHGGKWGVYNGSSTSNFSFGGLQMCNFILTENPYGASMENRLFYANKPWEGGINVGGGEKEDTRKYNNAYLFGKNYNEGNYWYTDVMTMTINRTVTLRDGAYNLAEFDVVMNQNLAGKKSVSNVTTDSRNYAQNAFYTVDQLNQATSTATAADAFFGMPSTVYSVRMYDRTLTEAEMQQNHAVDLMAYFKLNVTGFAAADDEAKALVYETFAGYTFADTDKAAEMQAVIDAAVTCVPTAEGFQIANDGTALRIWASIESFDGVHSLGMIITFKQNGEVIYTGKGETQTAFLSITAGETTITAEELGAEGLYAASVSGFAAGTYTVEVKPYAILTDGTTVMGVTKSAEIEF